MLQVLWLKRRGYYSTIFTDATDGEGEKSKSGHACTAFCGEKVEAELKEFSNKPFDSWTIVKRKDSCRVALESAINCCNLTSFTSSLSCGLARLSSILKEWCAGDIFLRD